MARRNELKVGQVRELRHPSTGRFANTNRAKCRILALDQFAELYSRGDGSYASSGYKEHQDLVLVEVLEANGWRWDSASSLQTRSRPVKKIDDRRARYGSQRWETELLPKDQYLVKPKLLGAIWNEEEKMAEARIEAIYAERQRLFNEEVREQDQRLSEILETADVSSSKWRGDHTWHLSSNDLAKIIEDVSHGTVSPGQVHWKDYQDKEVEL